MTSSRSVPRPSGVARTALPTARLATGVVACVLLAACGDKPDSAAAAPARDGATRDGATRGGARGAAGAGGAGAPGAPGAGGGRRGASTVMLAATDVATAARGPIEAGVPVTGDLRPIETIDVRARLEGDIQSVAVREGQRVAAGQLLAAFEPSAQQSDRASAEADLASARNELSTAQWNADQAAELFKAGAIPERDQRAAQQGVVAARARVAASTARLRASSIVARDTRVVAPGTATVEKRLVAPGEHVARGTPMFTLVRSDVLELSAALPARQAGDVRPGQTVHFTVDGRRLDGRVARVSPTVDPATRAVTVYVQVPNPNGLLKGNSFATGRVVSRTVNEALLIPTAAVRQSPDEGKPFVYQITGDHLTRTPIELGIVNDEQGMAEVMGGLSEGARVVTGNVGTLGTGMKVQVLGGDRAGRNNKTRAER